MPSSISGTSFDEFLKSQVEVKPPTAEEIAWAIENFSSRADPPKVEVPVDPGGD